MGCDPSKIQEGHQILLLPAYRFIDVGGYKLLNNWLTYSKTTNNIPLLQQILLTLQHLPLTVDHLKQVPSVFPTSVPLLWLSLTDEKLNTDSEEAVYLGPVR